MEQDIKKIINYLNLGVSPTILSFPDDGISNLYDILDNLDQNPQNYDAQYAFVYISTQSLKDTDIDSLENCIDIQLKAKDKFGTGLLESLKEGYEIVVLVDDIEIYGDAYKLVASIDGLIKKYKNRVKFIYLIETPNIEDKFQKSFPVSSSIFDAIIYFKIGTWDKESIIKQLLKKPDPIDNKTLEQIFLKTNTHFGTFKRMYRDILLGSQHLDNFIGYLLDNMTIEEISTFKKVVNKMKLNRHEQQIVEMYEKVGFIVNGDISVPAIKEKLINYKIKQDTITEDNKLNINFDLFTKSEKTMIEYMHSNEEVSKEEMAKIIWGDQVDEKYSEWAIEQRMSRLRKKLKQSGYNIDIVTLYNKGYKLTFN